MTGGLLNLVINIITYLFLGLVALLFALFIIFPREMGLILDGLNGAMIADSIQTISSTIAKWGSKIPFIGEAGAGMLGAVVAGVLIGLCGVWVLIRTGKIDELNKLGADAMKGPARIFMLGMRGFPPIVILGIIGIIAIDLVKFKFLDIPGDVLKVILSAIDAYKELFNTFLGRK